MSADRYYNLEIETMDQVDVITSVFQHETMEFLSGEYESFLYDGGTFGEVVLRISLECFDIHHCNKKTGRRSVY